MKKSQHSHSWRLNKNNELCGINFGFEFCAEHEHGIMGIRSSFGIIQADYYSGLKKLFGIKPLMGIEARKINIIPEDLYFDQKGDFCSIYLCKNSFNREPAFKQGIESLSWQMKNPNGKDIVCMWDENSFMCVTTNVKNYNLMKEAVMKLNSAVFLSKEGLILSINDKLDTDFLRGMIESDLNAWTLKIKSDKTGIEKKLKKAKKEFFALKPGWNPNKKDEVWYWLNPVDQRSNNYGWYTVEELELWIKGEGPVVVKK